jgi:hypothetical protein
LIITIPAGEIMEWLTKYKLYRFFLGVAALVIGFTSQYLLTSNRPLIAAFLFALAVTLIILALRKQPGPMVEMSGFQPVESGKKLRWGCSPAPSPPFILGCFIWPVLRS